MNPTFSVFIPKVDMKDCIKIFITFIICFLFASIVQSQEKFGLCKVYVGDKTAFNKLLTSGIDLEGATGKKGDYFEIVLSENEISKLRQLGFDVNVQIDDLSKFYSERLYKGAYNALGFGYGSMGGYYTYNEISKQLDSMKSRFPALITVKQAIDSSLENRPIYAVKISDNPDINETEEPAVLYTALTHAREPEGMMTVIYYMWWLLENYGINPDATFLVDNRQIWFIPIINVDGYVYNQTNYPNGGGMWRKNRKNNGGSYGVDLNRNFGPYDYWNAPNDGSSTFPTDETYRGISPFSEPETQAIRDFVVGKNIKACLNYHTYSNLIVYPYGALMHETPDSLIYREFAKDMASWNGYGYGTDMQTVGYATRGNSDDFMYDGDIPNNGKVFAMTPEVGSGSDGFWPSVNRILPLAQQNLNPNIYISNIAGSYLTLQQTLVVDSSGDGNIDKGEKFFYKYFLNNKGLGSTSNVSVQIGFSNPLIHLLSAPVSYEAIPPFTKLTDSVQCYVDPLIQYGSIVKLYAVFTGQSGRSFGDTVSIIIGKKITNLVFADSASKGTGNWNLGSSWGLTSNNHTSPYSFTDSPSGQYTNSVDNSLSLKNSLDLSNTMDVKIKFWAKWSIEGGYDFATVEVSSNGGSTWNALKGKYTRDASGYGIQTTGTFGYDGTQSAWVEEEMDASIFKSDNFKFRFRMRSDGGVVDDGFYVDDIRLYITIPDTALYRDISYSPFSISFADLPIGKHIDTTISLSNLVSSNDTVYGSAQLVYGVNYNLSDNGIFSVGVGGEHQFHLSFNPITTGWLRDTLIITHNSTSTISPIRIPLIGFGYESRQFTTRLLVMGLTETDTLMFGEMEGATAGIDTAFGERELAPAPSYDTFDARWEILSTNGVRLDLKDTVGATNPTNSFVCKIQPGLSGYPIKLRWNSDSLSHCIFILKDSLGSIISVNMKYTDSLIITDESVNKIIIEHQYVPTITFSIQSGWNLVSVGNNTESMLKSYVFPTSVSEAFAFRSGYVSCDTLRKQEGYWLRFNYSGQISVEGYEISSDTVYLKEGWNLIGSISSPVEVQSIVTEPPDLIASGMYGYSGRYSVVDVIEPGKGYWVKAKQIGKLFLRLNK
jgi:carboxypeptidase T